MAQIKNELSTGKLGTIKYLRTRDKVGLDHVPHVVVGAAPEAVKEVVGLWLAGNNEALKNHPFQLLFLEEIYFQLEEFIKYSQTKKRLQENVVIFRNYIALIKPILEEKRRQIKSLGNLENDPVYASIKAQFVVPDETPYQAAA